LLVPWHVLVFDNLYRVRSLGRTVAALRAGVPGWGAVLASSVPRYGIEMPIRTAAAASGLALATGGGTRTILGLALAVAAAALPLFPGYPGQLDFTLLAASIGYAWTPLAWLAVALLVLPAARRGETASSALLLAGVWSVALSLRWDLRLVWPSYYGVLAPFLVLFVAARLASLVAAGPTGLAAACIVAGADRGPGDDQRAALRHTVPSRRLVPARHAADAGHGGTAARDRRRLRPRPHQARRLGGSVPGGAAGELPRRAPAPDA
jgi:hypothetical protein